MALLKKHIKKIILIFLFIILVFFAFFLYQKYTDNSNALQVKYINSNAIVLKNILPITDEIGKNIKIDSAKPGTAGYVEFLIANNSKKSLDYEIYLTPQVEDGNKVDDKYIKLYLNNKDGESLKGFETNILPTFSELNVLSDLPASRLLYSGTLKGFQKEKLFFRTWIADNYGKSDESEIFKFDLNVRAK